MAISINTIISITAKNIKKIVLLVLFLTLSFISPFVFSNPEEGYPAKSYTKLTVIIRGLDKSEEKWVMKNLSIKAAEKEKKLNEERIESLHQIAIPEITAVLEALGYYHAEISATLLPLESKKGFQAEYQIEKGQATRIRSLSITLQDKTVSEPEIQKLIMNPTLKKGNILTHSDYENYKQELLTKALQAGYLDAYLSQNELRIDRNAYSADIVIILNTGKQYKVGDLKFSETHYPESYLRRYLPFKSGDPYTASNLAKFQTSLTDSDLFSKVRIDPDLKRRSGTTIPLKVRLEPRPCNKFSGALGYGTDTGVRGSLGFERRLADHPGHRINTDLRVSQIRNQINLKYTLPGENPCTDRIIFGVNRTEEQYRDHKYSRYFDAAATQVKKFGCWDRIFSIRALSEAFRVLPTQPKRHSHFLLPSLTFIWTNIEKHEFFDSGFRASQTFRCGLDPIFSSTNVGQTELHLKWIPLLDEETRLILRGDLGASAVGKKKEMPLSMRFFTGGDFTVRGYAYKSLGPTTIDAEGNRIVVGGRYLLVGSLELERHLFRKLSFAIFTDAGNAMDRFNTPLAKSVGIGIRWATPLGPFRLDLAKPTDKGKHKPRLHVTFGLDL